MQMTEIINGLIPNAEEWAEITKLDLNPEIGSPKLYAEELLRGMTCARLYSKSLKPGLSLDATNFELLHTYSFGRIFPWAGNFRETELNGAGGGFTAPDMIRAGLNGLTETSRKWFLIDDPNLLAAEMAAFNVLFHAQKPFAKGNVEVGWLILAHQSEYLFGKPVCLWSEPQYSHVTLAAATMGCFTPLALQILNHAAMRPPVKKLCVEDLIDCTVRDLRTRDYELSQAD